jgi:acyl-CoA dehydrogenase
MRWVGQAQRALDMMCERSTYRFAHGSVLADKQQIQVSSPTPGPSSTRCV